MRLLSDWFLAGQSMDQSGQPVFGDFKILGAWLKHTGFGNPYYVYINKINALVLINLYSVVLADDVVAFVPVLLCWHCALA